MNFKYNNVYVLETGTVVGPYEKKGTYGNLYDKSHEELYLGEKSWEMAETKLIEESVLIAIKKSGISINDIDIHLSGDLLNQLVASNYAAREIGIPFLGLYAACATSTLGIILASNMIEANQIKTAISSVSSHNAAAEKQFRYPVEYGGPKRKTTTFTSTGGASIILSRKKTSIKVESGTIGKVIDLSVKDVYNMGAVMSPAAAETLYDHLKANNRTHDYYDLILTGDLGVYGKKIFKEYLKEKYNIELTNYEDAGSILYNRRKQDVYAGGSGPACLPLITYSIVFDKMKKGEYKKVLLIATGSLHNVSMCNEKETIPAIAHAVSLEVIK